MVIEGAPFVYWWSDAFLSRYAETPKLRQIAPGREGVNTGNNVWGLFLKDYQPAPW